jgi:NACHT domain- and WD repeat-containing protein
MNTNEVTIPRATKTFRVFVSSSFADLKAERDALQECVYPRLRELCALHGCQFQAIDLRWGITEEASVAQQTMRICIGELERCQRITPRPNFIALLGDRYGWRPLPEEIPVEEFEALLDDMSAHNSCQVANAERWYRLDRNARARAGGVYVLQPRTDDYKADKAWHSDIEQPLRAALAAAAVRLGLGPQTLRRYVASATEQEIECGVSSVPRAPEHVLCFFRAIVASNGEPLARYMPQDPALATFLNLTDTGELDMEANDLLTALKDRLRGLLGTNVHEYTAQWTGAGITRDHIGTIPKDLDACMELLLARDTPATLCVDVWKRLVHIILPEIAKLGEENPLLKELEEHDNVANESCTYFVGRADALEAIADYISGPERRPFIVRGPPGIGKSALLAEAYKRTKEQWPNSAVIARFVGATPRSTVSRWLADDIAQQIHHERGDGDVSEGGIFADFSRELARRIGILSLGGPVIVFLDGYDELDPAPPFLARGPLPAELPVNAKLVVSFTDDCPPAGISCVSIDARSRAELRVSLGELAHCERTPLLEHWLSEADRTLTDAQWEEVKAKTSGKGVPLYLQLVFQEISQWRSYDSIHETALASDISGLLDEFLIRLSTRHNHRRLGNSITISKERG